MNIQELDILNSLAEEPFVSQRLLAERCGHSLGTVNRCVRSLVQSGCLDRDMALTEKSRAMLAAGAPQNAVILAAGSGMRMVPINLEAPKGLLEVGGEPLIERTIRQLRQAGITDVTVVVGFMKEQYEYLIDKFGVTLAVNPDYAGKNNLHSLLLAADRLHNTYVIPCDIWCAENPYRRHELYSWYMVSDRLDPAGAVRMNRRRELTAAADGAGGNAMIGISYLMEPEAALVRRRLAEMARDPRYDGAFWEETLYEKGRMAVYARPVPATEVAEINTYEQLRELDGGSAHLRSAAIAAAAAALDARQEEVREVTVLKKGMTNRSFLFTCRGRRYIARVPGEGSEKLIHRQQEAAVYAAIRGRGLCDDPVYLDPDSGYKITAYLEGARVCDPADRADVARCMEKLRAFHAMDLSVPHRFDIFDTIDYYESLWEGAPSAYWDHALTRERVFSLRPYIQAHAGPERLTHIDAVPDNFLFAPRGGGEELQLIDWEYAAMQDPHVDVAMFGIYSLYDRRQMDGLIDLYFSGGCPEQTRTKIYCYVAACGLLWSDWCEYKRCLGVEFGEYSLRQYRYAKDYYRLAAERIGGAL